MWRIAKYIFFIIICAVFLVFIAYKYEEKILFNNNMNQLVFDYLLLEKLEEGQNRQVATLLSADIQRVIIDISINNTMKDANRLCQYMDDKHINLLEEYDNNISIEYINKIMTYCVKLHPL